MRERTTDGDTPSLPVPRKANELRHSWEGPRVADRFRQFPRTFSVRQGRAQGIWVNTCVPGGASGRRRALDPGKARRERRPYEVRMFSLRGFRSRGIP